MAASPVETAEQEVTQGLVATASDTPVQSFYIQTLGGIGQLSGPFVKVEAGAHLTQGLSLFGQAGFERGEGWSTEAGLRFEF